MMRILDEFIASFKLGVQCFAISFEMNFYCNGFDALSANLCGREFGGVHHQGTMDVSNWLLVPSSGFYLGPQTWL